LDHSCQRRGRGRPRNRCHGDAAGEEDLRRRPTNRCRGDAAEGGTSPGTRPTNRCCSDTHRGKAGPQGSEKSVPRRCTRRRGLAQGEATEKSVPRPSRRGAGCGGADHGPGHPREGPEAAGGREDREIGAAAMGSGRTAVRMRPDVRCRADGREPVPRNPKNLDFVEDRGYREGRRHTKRARRWATQGSTRRRSGGSGRRPARSGGASSPWSTARGRATWAAAWGRRSWSWLSTT
jgi:hypothetical protein